MKTTHPTAHHLDYSQSAFEELEALNAQLTLERDDAVAERDEFKQRYYQVLEALRLARHQRFGKSSEIDTGQGELFDIEEDSIELDSAASQTSETSKTRGNLNVSAYPKTFQGWSFVMKPKHIVLIAGKHCIASVKTARRS
ncbi:MAG: hypothetical protein HRU48_17790 [Vibrio sp.]|uniref:transposase n=1 Tax=Vibrio sp. TaxID=678 RepID=UPI001EBE4352|nr:transposase [Vibrio sp.]NRB69191.1 hypothetical protein [Vibrio sp.]